MPSDPEQAKEALLPADGRASLAGALCCACLCHHMDLLALGYRGRAQHYLAAHAICARHMFCMPTTGLGATEFFGCSLPGGLPCLRLLKMCMCHWGAVHPPRAISCFCVCPCIYFGSCSPLDGWPAQCGKRRCGDCWLPPLLHTQQRRLSQKALKGTVRTLRSSQGVQTV